MQATIRAAVAAVIVRCALSAAEPLPHAILHRSYSARLRAAGSPACAINQSVFQLLSGALPPGVRLEPDGRIEGQASQPGIFRFATVARTACSSEAHDRSIAVRGAPILFASAREIELRVGEPSPLTVEASWPDLSYTVETSAAWLRAKPSRGRTPLAGSALAGDRVELLAAQPGETELLISAWRAVAPVRIRVRAR